MENFSDDADVAKFINFLDACKEHNRLNDILVFVLFLTGLLQKEIVGEI